MNMQPSSVTQPGFMFLLQGIGIVSLASPVFIVMPPDISGAERHWRRARP